MAAVSGHAHPMRRAAEATVVVAAAAAATIALMRFAPAYLTLQGFPADESWTVQVYARSLSSAGQLAFNPGVPTPGVTSLLWIALLAPIAAVSGETASAVLATKLAGLALHMVTSLVLLRALAVAGAAPLERLLGAALVAAHPDLIAAAAGGLEVPLAALAAVALLRTAQAGPIWPLAVTSAVAPLVRPDLAVLAGAMAILSVACGEARRDARRPVAVGLASLAALALTLGRDVALGGSLIAASPAAPHLTLVDAEIIGFRSLLGQIPITDSSILMGLAAAIAVWRLAGGDGSPVPHRERALPGAFLAALVFCAAGFALHPPLPSPASGAFGLADQRWPLPALPLLVGLLPALLVGAARAWLPGRARAVAVAGLAALLIVSVAVHAPRRHVLLASDARTVDELGVAAGRLLASAPAAETVWTVFPGAIRYFGGPRVVDLSGANEPEMESLDAPRFLAAHRPRYIEMVPGRGELDPASRTRVKAVRLQRPAHDVWTGGLPAEERWIVLCAEPGMTGQLTLDGRVLPFSCAGPAAPASR